MFEPLRFDCIFIAPLKNMFRLNLTATIQDYMLEKSRVVSRGPLEKNFHIFYYMFAGLQKQELIEKYIEPPSTYRFV